jgi:hypothetical protein
MRFELDEKFWVVRNPTPSSEIADVLFHASLKELSFHLWVGFRWKNTHALYRQSRGGNRNPRAYESSEIVPEEGDRRLVRFCACFKSPVLLNDFSD